MADVNSILQLFALAGVIGILISFLIKVSIQALVLRIFIKKYHLSKKYGKAWLVMFISSLVVSLLAIPLNLLDLSIFSLFITLLFFFLVLIISIKLIYKTETKISTAISFKFVLLILILMVALAGFQTIGGGGNYLESNVPQAACTLDCKFAYSLKSSQSDLIVTGYNVPSGKFQEKENYILAEKVYSSTEFWDMKAGWKDVNGNDRIIGELDVKGCTYMYFEGYGGGGSGVSCKASSKNFFTNLQSLQNILIQ